jgi:hypothetical protein
MATNAPVLPRPASAHEVASKAPDGRNDAPSRAVHTQGDWKRTARRLWLWPVAILLSSDQPRRYMTRAVVLVVAIAAAAVMASPVLGGSSADRTPVTLTGLVPDDWNQSISNADNSARNRWPGYARVWCRGVIIAGFRSQSSFIHGTTRYWDKTFCVALRERHSTQGSSFVLDAKGGENRRVAMYRVKSYRLPGSAPAPLPLVPPAPAPAPPPPAPSCDPNYSGGCVPNVPYDLDCADINGPVYVVGRDPHGFDGDGDGVGCE